VDDTFLTKAIVVDNTDIYKTNDPALAALGISLGNKQGAVVIESNDYNAGGEHYQLVGAQVLTSTEGISGTGIDLNSATGAGGASTGTEAFGAITTDTDVFKIVTAGFITTNTTTQDANLQFDVTNVDGDGDKTASQTLNVTVEGSTTFVGTTSADVIYGATGNDSLTGNGGNDIFVLQASGGGIDTIADLNVSGIDEIVVNIASQTLSISNAALIDAATQFNSGSGAPTSGGPAWAENPGGGDKFYYDTTNHNVWYSAGGTGADQVQLAHLSTGVPAADVAAAIHVA
jgi:Ca2+-binding RTX toxin-like protein